MIKSHLSLTIPLAALLVSTASSAPITVTHFESTPIADTIADWPTGTSPQGQNSWTYGVYNQASNPGVFVPFNTDGTSGLSATSDWTGSAFDIFNGNPPWTTMDSGGGHPNGDNNGTLQWAVRRYTVEPVSNPLANSGITINYSYSHGTAGAGTNGTTVGLIHNGASIISSQIPAGGGTNSETGSFSGVAVGDTIDFYLSPEGTALAGTPATINHDGNDSSTFSAVFTMEESYTVEGVLIADSRLDFPSGGTSPQGLDGWSYGYYDITTNGAPDPGGADLVLFNETTHWNGSTFDLGAGSPWTQLASEGAHPNDDTNGDHWVTRRYTVQPGEEGDLLIEWDARKENIGGGDGVILRVLVDGVEAQSGTVAGTDGVGMGNFFQLSGVTAGTVIDFALDANVGQGSDGSIFGAQIYSIPEPGVSSIILLTLGVAFIRRRRN